MKRATVAAVLVAALVLTATAFGAVKPKPKPAKHAKTCGVYLKYRC